MWNIEQGLKLKKLYIKNYKVLKDFEIDFCDSDNNPLPIVVLAGVNGSGKTSVLEFLFDIKKHIHILSESKTNLQFILDNTGLIFDNKAAKKRHKENIYAEESLKKKGVAVSLLVDDKYFLGDLKEFLYYFPICQDNIKDLKVSIISFFRKKIKELDSFSKAIEEIKNFLNDILSDMGIYFELYDIDDSEKDNEKVIFKNKITQDKFLIENLSSGEKILLSKMLYLYFKDIKNTTILIDEPELSLHPTWQSKILKLYENYAKRNNCQIIIATHSPLILSSAKNEYIRILYFNENKVEVAKDIYSYGRDIDWVLQEVMGVEYIRNQEIAKQMDSIYKLIEDNNLNKAEDEINKLELVIGSNDSEILKLRNEIDFKRIEFEEDY